MTRSVMTASAGHQATVTDSPRPVSIRPDHYPTRSSAAVDGNGRVRWVDRNQPTVWTDAVQMHDHDLEHYRRAGYVTNEALLSGSEVERYSTELQKLINDSGLRDDDRVITEPDTGAIRSIFQVHEISDMIAELATDPRVLDTARAILGSDVYIHQSRINYMPGFVGNGFYWHSDFETWHAEDGMAIPRAVSLSIPLTDNHPYNGGLMLIPGSHEHFVPCPGKTPEDNHRTSLIMQQVGVPSRADVADLAALYGIEQFTGPAGSALWFDANILHGSANNITPYPRSNIYLVFNSVDNVLGVPFDVAEARPEYLAARDGTPLVPAR